MGQQQLQKYFIIEGKGLKAPIAAKLKLTNEGLKDCDHSIKHIRISLAVLQRVALINQG